MGALTDYYENQIIQHTFRTGSMPDPTNLFIGLLTLAPTDSTPGTEVSGGSYARVSVAAVDAQWTAPSSGNGTTSNVSAVTFPDPTANWGTVVAWGIYDAASGGNLLVYANLTASKTINNGDAKPSFAPGALTFQIDN